MSQETTIHLKGQKIAAKVWNHESGIPTLALHGWLDNAASFDRLAPMLEQCHIVAIDLPGHGFSEHQAPGSFIHMIDIAAISIQVANHLGWGSFALLGHSLGACINTLIAGSIPDRIRWAVMIDALGPITFPAKHAPIQFRKFVEELSAKPNKTPPLYKTLEDALQARLKVNPMKESSGRIIVERGLKQLENGQWTWRTDPRLLMPTVLHFTDEQVLAFLQEITCSVGIIRPDSGYPFPQELIQHQLKALKRGEIFHLPGQHHVHLDSPTEVANLIQSFFDNNL